MRTNWRRTCARTGALAGLALLLSSSAPAYYYYVHYSGRSGPFVPILERFDLTALTNNTVNFFVSDQSPQLSLGDTYPAVISEIRAAANTWNAVSTCALKLGYGGLYAAGSGITQNSPGINVEFSDDIPPGLLALSGPTVRGSVTSSSPGSFVPIVRSQMLLRRDLTQLPGPSYSELFFTTLVHEFGHTMGLQHTLASSAMSTAQTSTSTKAAPLGADDVAAISLLYPAAGYLSMVGSISGRITFNNGSGVNMASVVAISSSNPAVSTLTNPDGTYQIDGIVPGQYYVYVHPLPAKMQGESYPANILPPVDSVNAQFPAVTNFTTQFYPGTRDWTQAQAVFVYPGNVSGGVNFAVAQRNTSSIAGVRIYGFTSTQVAVTSAALNVGVPASLVAADATGLLLQNGSLAQGLNIGMLGTPAQIYNTQPYDGFVLFAVMVANTTGPGPKHLLFSTPTDLYVLPSGFGVTSNAPPSVTSITGSFDGNNNRIVLVGGSNLFQDTRIIFDGLPGTVEGFTGDGRMIVIPPSASGSYVSTVVALNSDGQSSLYLQGNTPSIYTFDPAAPPSLTVSPSFLTPGVDTIVDIVGTNTNFDAQTIVGFGSSDIALKRIQVLSPTHITATATAPIGPFVPTTALNITNGLRILAQSQGTPIGPPPQQ